MLVPRELLSSVVGLGFETSDGFNFTGIAYFVSVPAALVPGKVHVYLVTAGHSTRDRDNLVARTNTPGGGTVVDLLPQSDRWLRLTDPAAGEHYVDLAAVRWNPQSSYEAGYRAMPLAMLFDERLVGNVAETGVGIGDEVFAIGLTSVRYAKEQNAPVVRTGHIAMIPAEPMLVRFEEAGPELRMRLYLTELRASAGLDGSPVFARPRDATDASPLALLGTIVGAWDEGDATDLGLTKVLPAQLLSDLLGQEEEVERRREAEQRQLDDDWLADA